MATDRDEIATPGHPPTCNCGECLYRREQQRRERYYAERSAEWFASVKEGDTIPDLDFDTPLCSICTRSTHYEDGSFYCETCSVWWPQSGYGSQATRYDDDGEVAPLSGRAPTVMRGVVEGDLYLSEADVSGSTPISSERR